MKKTADTNSVKNRLPNLSEEEGRQYTEPLKPKGKPGSQGTQKPPRSAFSELLLCDCVQCGHTLVLSNDFSVFNLEIGDAMFCNAAYPALHCFSPLFTSLLLLTRSDFKVLCVIKHSGANPSI